MYLCIVWNTNKSMQTKYFDSSAYSLKYEAIVAPLHVESVNQAIVVNAKHNLHLYSSITTNALHFSEFLVVCGTVSIILDSILAE